VPVLVRGGLRGRLGEGIGDGLLQGHRAALGPGGGFRFKREDLDQFLERRRSAAQ
jgi:hypothetical protein